MAGKLITVFGATGQQGNGVVLALLASGGGYRVRALTRNPEGSKAKALLDKGCEVVKVDMEDRASVEAAIAGSYGVFSLTNFWGLLAETPENPKMAFERETTQGKIIGDACKKEGVKHLVFSGVEHVKEIYGKACLHFDSKGIVEKYLDEIQVPNTSTRVAFYYENFINYPPQKNDDGTYTMTWAMNGPMDTVGVTDLGPAVVTIFNSPEKYIGMKIGIAGDKMTLDEYAAIMSEATGKKLTYNQVPWDVFAKFPFPGADDMAAMFEFYEKGKYTRDAEFTRTLNPNLSTFKAWAEKNKDKIMAF